jgi:hypothetical protein
MANVAKESRKYINIPFDGKSLEAIDEFRFRNRFPTRTGTIRWLIEYALKQKPKKDSG